MGVSWKDLAKQAQTKALEVRQKFDLDRKHPICIYDICEKLGDVYENKEVTVQFSPLLGLEGMYINEERERRILISSKRPLPRKTFTCAHELGHHLFNHGLKVDQLHEAATSRRDPQEFLVNCFAGFLLMPLIAVRYAFTIRDWTPATATPHQIFTIACSFSVGYDTLIDHMTYALNLITEEKSRELKRYNPKKVRQDLLGKSDDHPLIIVDKKWLSKTIDIEVDYLLLLPKTVKPEGNKLSLQTTLEGGKLYYANQPGVVRVYSSEDNWAAFVRISCVKDWMYSHNRHIEECDNE